jgi:hypothetical protein
MAAGVDHRVDRAAASQRLAAWLITAAAAQALLRDGLEPPVVDPPGNQQRDAQGHADQRVAIVPAGLEQAHGDRRILGQARGEHASGRPGADNDVVERVGC